MKKNNNAVFIVNSPFQALSSISVVKQKKIDSPFFYVINGEGSFEKTTALLNQHDYHYIVIDRFLHWFLLIKWVRSMGHFQNVYMGDYFSIKEYIIAIAASSMHANVVYLDDGNSTLSIAPPVSRKRYYSLKNRLAWCAFGSIAWIKRINYSFCSIYDIEGKVKYPVKTNDLSCLINTNLSKPKNVTIFIGTHEFLYPDNVLLYNKLKEKGISTTLIVGEKQNHVYPAYPCREGHQAIKQIIQIINK